MATVTSSLQLFDAFTRPLQNITQALNMTISTMQQLQQSADRNSNIARSFDSAKQKIAEAEADMKRAIESTTAAQERLNQKIGKQPTPPSTPMAPNPSSAAVWETQKAPIVFQATGMERMVQEMESAKALYRDLQAAQRQLSNADMKFLPPQAVTDINKMEQRIMGLHGLLEQVEASKAKLGGSTSPEAFNAINSSIENIRGQLSDAIQLQNRMNAAMKKGDLSAANSAYQRLNGVVDSTEREIRQNIEQQQKFNRAIEDGSKASNGLRGKIGAIGAAYLALEAAKKLAVATIGGAMEQEKMQDMFKARTGDDQVGAAMFEKFKADALKAGMDVKESLQGTLSFFSMTQDTRQLEKLNNLTQRLNAFDSAGNGMEGAAFALKEAMSGDIVSLAERFNMSKTDIRAFKIDDLGKAGDMDGFIKAFDQLLEKQKMGQAAFEKMLASPAKQAEILKNNLKSGLADAGGAAMRGLLPLIQLLNKSFQEGRFDGFFRGLEIGLRVVSVLFIGVVHGALWLGDVIQELGPVIGAILTMIGIWLTIHLIAKLWAALPPLFAQAAAWLAINWPILLIIAAIGLLVYVLGEFGVTGDQMVGIVFGAFMVLFTMIRNRVAVVWNLLASFAEFFINLFIDPVYSVKKLFYDLAMLFLEVHLKMIRGVEDFAGTFMTTILKAVNAVLKSFNWLIDALNKLPGFDIKKIELFDENNVHAMSEGITKIMNLLEKPVSDKQVVSIARMEQLDYKNEFDYGYKAGANLVGKVKQSMDFGSTLDDWNKKSTINRVNEVGEIKDKVDISSEDLRVMRDLAEMKNIQNFVTLTPIVEVRTGDIRHEVDVYDVVRQIEDVLTQEITSAAEGLYDG